MEMRLNEDGSKLRQDALNWANQFTWELFCTRIYEEIKPRLVDKGVR